MTVYGQDFFVKQKSKVVKNVLTHIEATEYQCVI